MARTFEMIQKGYEYATEGYTISKFYDLVNTTNCGHSVLDHYRRVARWIVHQDGEPRCWTFPHLADAKRFILTRDQQLAQRPEEAKNMNTRQSNYLFNLAEATVQMRGDGQTDVVQQNKATARGYIKALIDCGVLGEGTFRTVWEWWKGIAKEA